jgi:UDP-glucose 4-epimerase
MKVFLLTAGLGTRLKPIICMVVIDYLIKGHCEAIICGTLIQSYFGDRDLLNQLMNNSKFDAVIHFAASASVPDSVLHPAKYYRNNMANMQTLLDACIGHEIKYFVFSSSAAIFENPQFLSINENHPQSPINPYGTTKLIGEKLLADYEQAYGLKYCAFYYFSAAGSSKDGKFGKAHHPETHLIPVIIQAALSGNSFNVFGADYDTRGASCIHDFIHVLDLAEAHYLGLQHIIDNNCSDVFNLGSNDAFTVLEMIHALQDVTRTPVPYRITGRREGNPIIIVASNEKAQDILSWKPKYSKIENILVDAWK